MQALKERRWSAQEENEVSKTINRININIALKYPLHAGNDLTGNLWTIYVAYL